MSGRLTAGELERRLDGFVEDMDTYKDRLSLMVERLRPIDEFDTDDWTELEHLVGRFEAMAVEVANLSRDVRSDLS